jgi:hypothetical protein
MDSLIVIVVNILAWGFALSFIYKIIQAYIGHQSHKKQLQQDYILREK